MIYKSIALKDFVAGFSCFVDKSSLDIFAKSMQTMIDDAQSDSNNEEFQKNIIAKFLEKSFDYDCNVLGKADLAIYDEGIAKVLFEVKSTENKTEFVKSPQNLESKAFYESILYFLREFHQKNNNNIKHIILCTAQEFYVIKAKDYHKLFIANADKAIQKAINTAYNNCDFKQGNDTSTPRFYAEIENIVREMSDTLEFCYINVETLLDSIDSHESTKDLSLFYALLSKHCLLDIPRYIDANTLNERFYNELLYILGLKQVEISGKMLIKPNSTPNALLDCITRAFSDKLPSDLDEAFESHIFPLLMLWNNRILFLRLLESMLLNFKHIEKPFLNIEILRDFGALNTLFFKVLAIKERTEIPQNLSNIPYLNSSLFEKSALESQGFEIALLNSRPLKIAPNSILHKDKAQNTHYKNRDSLPF